MTITSKRQSRGFTLIEMIGVLAVVAILASLLIPKIYEAIDNARLSHTVMSVQTMKTAVLEHYAKFLSLNSSNGTPLIVPGSYRNFDSVLLAEGLIDKPFAPKLGTNATIQLVDVSQPSGDATKGDYDLDGDGNGDMSGANFVVEAFISSVTQAEARALNDLLDGPSLGEAPNNRNATDAAGRVVYNKTGAFFDVHIYLTHH